ncbi:dihydroorotate dehydrogenase electron transfer subunit [Candidatus Bathyarchaeota archaeon B24-2]|nr:MAG: dihydroorotate dehydrogenase electron transfer subunit [Candidatus Bathyarchaeota archaeon B24-2]
MRLSGFRIDVNVMRITRITSVVQENPEVKTLYFEDELSSKGEPGQFLMVWIPGVDEVPMSLSSIGPGNSASITVRRVGEATSALHSMKAGDRIGIRGPYGVGFKPIAGRVVLVAGGVGVAPLYPLLIRLKDYGSEVYAIIGFKSREDMVFLDRIIEVLPQSMVTVTTEDGSYGVRGVVTDVLRVKLEEERYDMVYACGPEGMLREVYDLTKMYRVPVQLSLERYIRCGMGVCGSCCLGEYRICRDGPVFSGEQLLKVEDEFGNFKLDRAGRRLPIKR